MKTKSAKKIRFTLPALLAFLFTVVLVTPAMAGSLWPVIALAWGNTVLPGDIVMAGPAGVEAVSVDASTARVYVADTNNNRVAIYTVNLSNPISATYISQITGGGGTAFNKPRGIAVDSAGNIYVSDSGNGRIVKFDNSNAYQYQTGGFFNPGGLAVDSSGTTLYVADTGNTRLVKLNAGDLTGTTSIGTFNGPQDVVVDSTSTFAYLADTYKDTNNVWFSRVVRINLSNNNQNVYTSGLNGPVGIAVDSGGILYVSQAGTSSSAGQVTKLSWPAGNTSPTFAKTFGSFGTAVGQFKAPGGITALSEDMIFVADAGNNRIEYFEPNKAPTDINLDNTTLLEDVYSSTHVGVVGTVTVTDSNLLDNFTYSMITNPTTCADSGKFLVGTSAPNIGKLITNGNQTFDFESTKTSYQVCIKVTDNAVLSIPAPQYKAFTISITNGDDAPIVTANGAAANNTYTIDEYTSYDEANLVYDSVNSPTVPSITNPSIKTKPGLNLRGSSPTLGAVDNDTSDFITKYEIVGGTFANAFEVIQVAGTNNGDVKIKNTLDYKTVLNYETNTQGSLIIRVTDNDLTGSGKTPNTPNYTDINLTIKLNNKNDWPILTMPTNPFTINENVTTANTQVGDLITAWDEDAGNEGLTFDPPTPANPYFITKKGTTVGKTTSFSITTTNNPVTPVDFEKTPVIDLKLKVSDGGYDLAPLHITVNDKNDKPVLVSTYDLHNTSPVGTVLDLDTSNDANDPLTYNILSGNDLGTFAISNGQIVVADTSHIVTLDPASYLLDVTVQDTRQDPAFGLVEKLITINITQGNRAPVFVTSPAPALAIPENTTDGAVIAGYIDATDEDGDPLTFSTDTTDTLNPFVVTTTAAAPWRGIVKVNTGHPGLLNYETKTSYDLAVTVNDGNGGQKTQTFTVSISNVNEQIQVTGLNPVGPTFSVGDRSTADTVITTINWSDPDQGTQPTFTATGDTDGFNVNSSGKVIKVAPVLHYYQKKTYSLIIFVCDNLVPGSTGDRTCADPFSVTINLSDDQDPPTFQPDTTPTTLTVPEKSPNATVVGTFNVFDENGDDFSVNIGGGTGQAGLGISYKDSSTSVQNGKTITTKRYDILVTDGTKLDYETAANHKVTLSLTGADNQLTPNLSAYTYEIGLTDINEAPIFIDQTMYTYEKANPSTVVGNLNAYDPDAGDSLTYAIMSGSGKDCGCFGINSSGQVYVINGKSDFLTTQASPFTMVIQVADKNQPTAHTATATVTINIVPKADPAIISASAPAEVLTGSLLTYEINVKNLGQATSSNYTISLTLPNGVSFITTAGCGNETVTKVVCQGDILGPAETNTFRVHAYLNIGAANGSQFTTPIELTTDVNDLSGLNNTGSVLFTARKSLTVTDQNFENLNVADFYRQNLDQTLTSLTNTNVVPSNNTIGTIRNFLGKFINDTIVFKKDALLPHSSMEVTFDLYLGYAWWGVNSGDGYGPSIWKTCEGPTCEASSSHWLLDTTFSTYTENQEYFKQNYPLSRGAETLYQPFTGAFETDVLGFNTTDNKAHDSVYKLHFGPFTHSDPSLILKFIGESLNQNSHTIPDEPIWGIDNVKIIMYGDTGYDTYIPLVRR